MKDEVINKLAEDACGMQNIKGDIKKRIFEANNKIFKEGGSRYIAKIENINTLCGSCITRVKRNFWKFYHFEHKNKSEKIEFYMKEGGGKLMGTNYVPIYIKKKA